MNIDTGQITDIVRLALLSQGALRQYASRRERSIPMIVEPTQKQLARNRVGRNDPCPCGSSRKFKRCCYRGQGAP
jgi:uncharacterized protein YecA (UPF0149 family)